MLGRFERVKKSVTCVFSARVSILTPPASTMIHSQSCSTSRNPPRLRESESLAACCPSRERSVPQRPCPSVNSIRLTSYSESRKDSDRPRFPPLKDRRRRHPLGQSGPSS